MINELSDSKATCPRCGHVQSSVVECASCGVIIEKASRMQISIDNNKKYLLGLLNLYREHIQNERMYIYPNIPIEVLEEALASYSKQSLWLDWNSSKKIAPPFVDLDEEIIFIYSNTILNNRASSNFILSTSSLYCCDVSIRNVCSSIKIDKIRVVKILNDKKNSIRINNKIIVLNGISSNNEFVKFIARFFNDMARDFYFASKNYKSNPIDSSLNSINDLRKTEGAASEKNASYASNSMTYLMNIRDNPPEKINKKIDAFGIEKKLIKMGPLAGIFMILIAGIWFIVGYRYDRIFLYPPVLLVIGLYVVIKGLFDRVNSDV